MHFSGLILGPDPAGQLSRYDENREVEPYLGECWNCCGLERFQPCAECSDSGKILTTRNPEGEWDYWRIGGRYRGLLHLKPDAMTAQLGERSWEWDHSSSEPDWAGRADVAFAGEVDWDRTIAEMGDHRTYFIVAEGVWRARERWSPDADTFVPTGDYERLWDSLVRGVPASMPVTIVDAHS